MNTKQGVWLLGVLGFIMVALIAILIFVPGKTNAPNPATNTEGIKINSLQVNSEISSPLKITGTISGNGWVGFEGQVGVVKLLDSNEKLIAMGIMTATTEWTTLPTNFETTLNFATPNTENGTLVFKNENASGLPEKDKTFSLPIKFSKDKTIEVEVFFGNLSFSSSGEQDECLRVYKTSRYIGETTAVAKTALEELLKGVTDSEKAWGFFTSIPAGSKLNSISIVNGQARADFNAITESGGGSCSMAARTAQITKTLMQFPTVTSVRLSINGRTADIFQP